MSDYKKINVGGSKEDLPSDLEIELTDDETNNDDNVEQVTNDDDVEDSSTKEQDSGDDDEDSQQEKDEDKPKKRGRPKKDPNTRIRQLVSEKNEFKQQNEALSNKVDTLQNELEEIKNSIQSTKQETTKQHLEDNYKKLQEQLKQALDDDNHDEVTRIQDTMFDTKVQLNNLGKPQQKEEETKSQQQQEDKQSYRQQQNEVPQAAIDWIEEFPEFTKDPIFNGVAMTLNRQLIAERYDPTSEDFYEELTERLKTSNKFPEIFGGNEEDDVQLDSEDSSGTDVKRPKKSYRYTEQVVSGASRNPQGGKKPSSKAGNRNTVKLTPEEQKQAQDWGISYEQYAKRKRALANREDKNEYTPIKIN